MYHRPVCVKCECEMRPEQNGVGLLDYFNPSDSDTPQPYRIWDADLWKCPKCGFEIVTGFGQRPIAEHYQQNKALERTVFGYEANGKVIRNYS